MRHFLVRMNLHPWYVPLVRESGMFGIVLTSGRKGGVNNADVPRKSTHAIRIGKIMLLVFRVR